MDHIAIMNKSWDLIPKILQGQKTIESRWYKTRRAPWNRICAGDVVYFKNSGEDVIALAKVSDVLQFKIKDTSDVNRVIKKYGQEICLINDDPDTWGPLPNYCILIFLKDPKTLENSFAIDKTGFGIGAAWLVVDDINKIKIDT